MKRNDWLLGTPRKPFEGIKWIHSPAYEKEHNGELITVNGSLRYNFMDVWQLHVTGARNGYWPQIVKKIERNHATVIWRGETVTDIDKGRQIVTDKAQSYFKQLLEHVYE